MPIHLFFFFFFFFSKMSYKTCISSICEKGIRNAQIFPTASSFLYILLLYFFQKNFNVLHFFKLFYHYLPSVSYSLSLDTQPASLAVLFSSLPPPPPLCVFLSSSPHIPQFLPIWYDYICSFSYIRICNWFQCKRTEDCADTTHWS